MRSFANVALTYVDVMGIWPIVGLVLNLLLCKFVNSEQSFAAEARLYTLPQLLQSHTLVSVSFYPSKQPCSECQSYSRLLEETAYRASFTRLPVVFGASQVPEIAHPFTMFFANGQFKKPIFTGPIEKLALKVWLRYHLGSNIGFLNNNKDLKVDTLSADMPTTLRNNMGNFMNRIHRLNDILWNELSTIIPSAVNDIMKSVFPVYDPLGSSNTRNVFGNWVFEQNQKSDIFEEAKKKKKGKFLLGKTGENDSNDILKQILKKHQSWKKQSERKKESNDSNEKTEKIKDSNDSSEKTKRKKDSNDSKEKTEKKKEDSDDSTEENEKKKNSEEIFKNMKKKGQKTESEENKKLEKKAKSKSKSGSKEVQVSMSESKRLKKIVSSTS